MRRADLPAVAGVAVVHGWGRHTDASSGAGSLCSAFPLQLPYFFSGNGRLSGILAHIWTARVCGHPAGLPDGSNQDSSWRLLSCLALSGRVLAGNGQGISFAFN